MTLENGKELTDAKGNKWIKVFLEYVLPTFLLVFAVLIIFALVWFGPVGMIKHIVSFIPAKPGPEHALIMGVVLVAMIVFLMPFWPPVMLAIGMVFGFWRGFIIDFSAMVTAAVISFFLARFMCMRSVRGFIEDSDYIHVRRLMRMIEKEDNSLKFLFMFRFLFSPIWIRNYIPGLLDVSFWSFLLTVCVHGVWICAVFAAVGSAAKDIAEALDDEGNKNSGMHPYQITIFVISMLAWAAITLWSYREYQKFSAEEEEEPLLQQSDVASTIRNPSRSPA